MLVLPPDRVEVDWSATRESAAPDPHAVTASATTVNAAAVLHLLKVLLALPSSRGRGVSRNA